ncbi:glutathione-S-transferase [Wolfiporia cocos MD-104 SS10]|uniref:Glutathione-S-transferase n=1 Tax=Wolfiporia cocos (strain MD-104) TaxID=742152 RepID=A0A2H3JFS7_WOLCO|nr:glutathione-S-transferase [Wolfiporia cocos MD-104 SS10]
MGTHNKHSVWIALEEKKILYQYKEVNPYKKGKHFLDINPKGLVPEIEYQGRALHESLILCEFLEDVYPDHAPRLLPKDPFERAYVRLWINHVSKSAIPAFYRTVHAQEPDKQQAELQEFHKALRTIAEKAKGPYFLGDQFSLVDVVIAPWAVRDYITREHRGYIREAVGGGWKEWAEQLEKRESVIKTLSLLEHYQPFFERFLRDEAQGEVAKATRSGRGSSIV